MNSFTLMPMRADIREFEHRLMIVKKLVRLFQQKVNFIQASGRQSPHATLDGSTGLAELDQSTGPVEFDRRTGLARMTSPVPALFLSNRAPDDAETESILKSITAADYEITWQIKHSQRPQAGRQIDIYKEFIRLHSTLLSKVRQLPPVILTRIFLCFTEKPEEKPLSNKPPWVLGQVCCQWRDIALATPNLWRHLPPVYLGPRLRKHDVDKIFTCLSSLLDRCLDVPISFFLHNEAVVPLEYPIIDLLVAHCGQWENVALEVSGITVKRFFKAEGRLNSLYSLEFSLRGRGEPVVKLFESAPRLRKVCVNNLVSPGMLRLPWTQLTSYIDTTAFGEGLSNALCSGSRLQHLEFSSNRDERLDFPPEIQWKPLTFSYLTTLGIEYKSRFKIKTLFDNLTLPILHTLVLRLSEDNEVVDVALVNMIARSRCEVKHLTFHGHDSPIHQSLAVMKSLTSLDINDPDPELIKKLCRFRGGEWTVAPRLRSLIIHLSESYEHPYLASLSRLAGIRCDTVSAFRNDEPSLSMLKSLKIASHGPDDSLSHFHYASLEPPTTELEAWSANAISEAYISMKVPSGWHSILYEATMNTLESLLDNDPQGVAGVYVSGIDLSLYRHYIAHSPRDIYHFDSWVSRCGSKLSEIAPTLKWDWDDDGYLVYIPYEDRQLTRAAPKLKCQRSVYRKIPADQLPAGRVKFAV